MIKIVFNKNPVENTGPYVKRYESYEKWWVKRDLDYQTTITFKPSFKIVMGEHLKNRVENTAVWAYSQHNFKSILSRHDFRYF